jgi:glycosyltransferase involved in cell wall biosynthesis
MSGSDQWVSVVMPVRNALPYLDASIGSILGQSHRRIELVIGDDASTDGSRERLLAWASRDPRIRLLDPTTACLGPAESSNWVVRQASHAIVARMDADDVSRPGRIEAQLAALEGRSDAVLVGTLFECIDTQGRTVQPRQRTRLASPTSGPAPFSHGSIMFRRNAFEQAGGYRSACDFWEDQELYWRMAAVGPMLVLPEPLYAYRYNHGHSRLAAGVEAVERALDLAARCFAAHERGDDYRALLLADTSEAKGKVCPRAILALGSLQLWSGRRPRLLKRLLTRSLLRFDRETMAALVWATCGAMAPTAMRLALKARYRAREARQGRKWPDGCVYEWRPRSGAPAGLTEETGTLRAA